MRMKCGRPGSQKFHLYEAKKSKGSETVRTGEGCSRHVQDQFGSSCVVWVRNFTWTELCGLGSAEEGRAPVQVRSSNPGIAHVEKTAFMAQDSLPSIELEA